MRYRKLRVAWSVVWGVAAVLLIVLWVRSSRRFDTVTAWIPERGLATSSSAVGRVAVQFYNRAHLTKFGWSDRLKAGEWYTREYEPEYVASGIFAEEHGLPESPADIVELASQPDSLSFAFKTYKGSGFHLILPHWFLLLTTGAIAGLPWLRLRFTTRTLLIATTLIAVMLALIIYCFGELTASI